MRGAPACCTPPPALNPPSPTPTSPLTPSQECWAALAAVSLAGAVEAREGALGAAVEEGGSNWSVGQRQLLCLARAALRGTKMLLMDEATANVDEGTDALIAAALRTAFPAATILTVAHRLSTVIDFDTVVVLNEGRVAEFGAPHELLREGAALGRARAAEGGRGAFWLLANSAGEAAGAALGAAAEEAAARRRGGE